MSATETAPPIDVFVSYARADRARIAPILDGLRHEGLSVWWDGEIPVGASWRQTLIEHLNSARCVIVVWSETSASVAGEFVQDEAGRAKSRRVMLPLRIDDVTEPLGYGEIQSLDLVNWSGDVDDPRFQDLVHAVRAMSVGSPRPGPTTGRPLIRAGNGFLDRWISLTRDYFVDLLDLVSGPKRFLAERLARPGATAAEGLQFLAISFGLMFVLQLPLARSNPLTELIGDISFFSGYMLLYGCAVLLAWRLVGAAAPVYRYFMIHFYISGVLRLILAVTYVVARGILRSDPAAYEEVMASLVNGDIMWGTRHIDRIFGSRALQLSTLVLLGGLGAMLVWVVVSWGAYRQLSGMSKFRSLLAFLLFCVICVPVYILTTLIAAALIS